MRSGVKVAHSPHKARAVVQFYSLAIQEEYINWKGDTNMDIMQEINQNGLTKEQYEKCLQTILNKKNGIEDIDWQEIVDVYNLPVSSVTLRKANGTIFGGAFVAEYYKTLDKNEQTTEVQNIVNNSEVSINKDGTYSSKRLLAMNEHESKDPEYLLKAHGFDTDAWEIVSVRNNIRQAISRDDGVVTLYASFLTAKPIKEDGVSLKKIEDFFNRLDRNYSLPKIKERYDYLQGDKLLLINIADLHLNLQSTMMTTGNEYNCDIAEKLFFYVIEDILTRTQTYNFEEIVFTIGGDMLNGDSLSGTTTKGTPQNNDTHYYDAYERLCAMTIKAIDVLRAKAKVRVIYVPGNHDEQTGFKLAKYIDAWYRNDESVNVDYSPLARKYYKFGKTLLCFAHDADVKTLPMLIADEAREYWSSIDTTEVFLQHLHSENVIMEKYNMRIQRLPTISAKSKWSTDKGYSSKRQCKTFVFDIEDGLTDILYTPIKI